MQEPRAKDMVPHKGVATVPQLGLLLRLLPLVVRSTSGMLFLVCSLVSRDMMLKYL